MQRLEDTMNILRDLGSFATISTASNQTMINYLAKRLSDTSARTKLFQDTSGQKANLFATPGPAGSQENGNERPQDGGILPSSRTDMVPVTDQIWSHNPFKLCEHGGALRGRGTCDMKGFIAATLAMAPDLSLIHI